MKFTYNLINIIIIIYMITNNDIILNDILNLDYKSKRYSLCQEGFNTSKITNTNDLKKESSNFDNKSYNFKYKKNEDYQNYKNDYGFGNIASKSNNNEYKYNNEVNKDDYNIKNKINDENIDFDELFNDSITNINSDKKNNFNVNTNQICNGNNNFITKRNYVEEKKKPVELSANQSEWGRDFSWDSVVNEALLHTFSYTKFRTNQREIINAALAKRDVFVCMPTGGGKSITYQIPAILGNGITVVIMPLLSLMYDQLTICSSLGIPSLSTSEESVSWKKIVSLMNVEYSSERLKILFITPEKIEKNAGITLIFSKLYEMNLLERFVIDEAHCMSKWGNEFREDYLKLGNLRLNYPKVPFLALTATATVDVRNDVMKCLYFKNGVFFNQSYDRPNLYIEVRKKEKNYIDDIYQIIENHQDETGIIYSLTTNDCEKLTEKLIKKNVSCAFYHGKMKNEDKNRVQKRWKTDKIKVVIATCAFGMGINKENVRYVIHESIPKSFENYYQEIGRAGRDSKPADCILYYSNGDKMKLFNLTLGISKSETRTKNAASIYKMIEYAWDSYTCRKKSILNHFDENYDKCNNCDNCSNENGYIIENKKEIAEIIINTLKLISNKRYKPITYAQLINFLEGKSPKGVELLTKMVNDNDFSIYYKKFDKIQEDIYHQVMRYLLINEYINEELYEMNNKNLATRLSVNYNKPLPSEIPVKINLHSSVISSNNIKSSKEIIVKEKKKKKKNTNIDNEDIIYDPQMCRLNKENTNKLYKLLLIKRKELLAEHNNKVDDLNQQVVQYIFSDQGLVELAKKIPTKKSHLNNDNIFGVSKDNLNKYGIYFLDVILNFCEENGISINDDDREFEERVNNQINQIRLSTNNKENNSQYKYNLRSSNIHNKPEINEFCLLNYDEYKNEKKSLSKIKQFNVKDNKLNDSSDDLLKFFEDEKESLGNKSFDDEIFNDEPKNNEKKSNNLEENLNFNNFIAASNNKYFSKNKIINDKNNSKEISDVYNNENDFFEEENSYDNFNNEEIYKNHDGEENFDDSNDELIKNLESNAYEDKKSHKNKNNNPKSEYFKKMYVYKKINERRRNKK